MAGEDSRRATPVTCVLEVRMKRTALGYQRRARRCLNARADGLQASKSTKALTLSAEHGWPGAKKHHS